MPVWPLDVRCAPPTESAFSIIVSLIDEAAMWLGTKDTDQWKRPWPTRADRDGRIQTALSAGKTWICWDREEPAATLTSDLEDDPYWASEYSRTVSRAVYVHRLVVARRYAGLRLGASLLDWTGRTARLAHGARSMRVSAWTTNVALHRYYERQGFDSRGQHADDGYPSGARFEKSTSVIPFAWPPLFSAPSRLIEP
jgi:GNAT superfamily N-acetyltransferase